MYPSRRTVCVYSYLWEAIGESVGREEKKERKTSNKAKYLIGLLPKLKHLILVTAERTSRINFR